VALWLAIGLTILGAATVLSIESLSEADLGWLTNVAVAVLDLATVALVVALARVAVVVSRRPVRPGRMLAGAYIVTIAGVVTVLMCIAWTGLPHLEGGIRALLP
jgi:uncharacterized protein involved in response to NO